MAEMDAETNESFPFMKLPGELRNMVYEELLVSPEINLVDSLPRCLPRQFEALVLVSKQMRREAIAIIFGCNSVESWRAQELAKYLYRIGPDCCNAIKKVTFKAVIFGDGFQRDANKAFKLLAQCANLRKLHIGIDIVGPYDPKRSPFLKRPGVQNLLKIRGIQRLNVKIKHYGNRGFQYDPQDFARDRQTFRKAIRILKQPRDFEQLKRLAVPGLWMTNTRITRSMSRIADSPKAATGFCEVKEDGC